MLLYHTIEIRHDKALSFISLNNLIIESNAVLEGRREFLNIF